VVGGGNRFLSIGAAAGSLALLAAVVLMLWPPDPGEYAFTPGRDRPDGETVGWVSKVEANTIHVNSGPFGGGVVPLVVTKTTRITVGAKDGWFEDIRPGGQVKVAYELYHGRRFARSVELLVDEGARRPVRATPQVKGPVEAPVSAERVTSAPAPQARPAPAPPPPAPAPTIAAPAPSAAPASASKVAVPTPVVPVAPPPPVVAVPAPAPRPAPATAAAKPAPAPEIRPAPRPEPAPVPARPQPVEVVPPPQRASTTPTRNVSAPENGARAPEPARAVEVVRPPAPAAPRPTEPARAVESEATDGSAAVDWLLKRR
jgi:hypothetical protein